MDQTETSPRLSILIADDQDVVRCGLRALIEGRAGWTVAGEASNGREAIEQARALEPDVVLIDLEMPLLNGLEATRQIVQERPRTAIVVLWANDPEGIVREALLAGARGIVSKMDARKDLTLGVEAVSQGRSFFSAPVADVVVRGYLDRGAAQDGRAPGATGGALTARERGVLQLLAEGRSNKEVAAELGIGVKTAEAHRANMMRKLALRSIGELVRYAIRNGIIRP